MTTDLAEIAELSEASRNLSKQELAIEIHERMCELLLECSQQACEADAKEHLVKGFSKIRCWLRDTYVAPER